MLKFIRGKGQQPSAERQKLQRELFAFRKTVHHGFPNKPTCLAWDPVLRLMAIGTTAGAIKVFGQPGVEFYGQHSSSDVSVTKVIFIPNQGRLVTLCEDNSLHLWEINDNSMEELKSHTMEGKLKKVSAMCLEGSEEHLLLGTEGGNIYLLNLNTFEPSDTIIYQDVVMHNVPEDYKINPGAVEAAAVQTGSPDNVLIGYNRGLIVLWNMKTLQAEQTYISTQGVESIHWCSKEKFVSSHNDGSYTQWQVGSASPLQDPNTVYGPFPCKAITKILTVPSPKGDEEMIVFGGGMQRASYSDRHTISVLDGENHVVFDFTSKVIDFFVASSGDANVLIVLAEEEVVALELDGDEWPTLELPYLVSLHASSVTCSTHVADVPQPLWEAIVAAGQSQASGPVSRLDWPVDGGKSGEGNVGVRRDVLLTGHEDGSVRAWEAGGVAMRPLYKFSSTEVMCPADEDCPDAEESHDNDDWPPFKKVGSFDPYSDDPRLAVKKVALCPITGTLAVAGTAGHVIVAKLLDEKEPPQVKVTTMNIVSSRDGFVWKGHEALKVRGAGTGTGTGGGGFGACAVLQLHPPAAVTALALHSGWGLVAAGTAHGVALYDYLRNAHVALKCTLNPNDLSGTGDAPISRRKSFKKSLRESFRRLRKGRSQRQEAKRTTTTAASSAPPRPNPVGGEGIETKPVERAVEARPVDDALGSMVRCLTFARTYIISVQNMTPTLWTGTNNGTVYVFTIAIPGGNKRTEEAVSCQLGKEIQLKHRAPVIGISLIDGLCNSVDTSRGDDHPPPHKVLICSEEQIKMFTVPALKPVCKLKLTAGEGARVRRTGLARFKAGKHSETCLLVLTNLGDVVVLSLPDLRRQMNAAVARREDINGISSLAFTEEGEAMYLHSSSELERVSVSAARATVAHCWLELPPGSRPPPPVADPSSSSSSSASSSSSSSASSDDEDSRRSTHGKTEERSNTANKEVVEIKENGVSDSVSGHDVTLSSVGDITIDSVKDHLTNNVANIEESRTVLTETKLESTVESVVVKTTVITNETTHITSPPTEIHSASHGSPEHAPPQPEVRKAPLARMEEMDGETAAGVPV